MHSLSRRRAPAGIFIKLDIESLLVRIAEEPTNFTHFLVRLCGIVGGFIVCSGFAARVVQGISGAIGSAK